MREYPTILTSEVATGGRLAPSAKAAPSLTRPISIDKVRESVGMKEEAPPPPPPSKPPSKEK